MDINDMLIRIMDKTIKIDKELNEFVEQNKSILDESNRETISECKKHIYDIITLSHDIAVKLKENQNV